MASPDPGGNFATDAHRRVMASLANPDEDHLSLDELATRIAQDDHLNVDGDETSEILSDLEADGDAEQSDGMWRNTQAGFDVLTGPIASDGGRSHE